MFVGYLVGVFNMLLVLSITFEFSLQYMGLYVFNWPISVLGDATVMVTPQHLLVTS